MALPARTFSLTASARNPSGAMILGGLAQMYVTIIGSQAWPLVLFPGQELSSSFEDGTLHHYAPSGPELLLGLGGVAFALLLIFSDHYFF